MIFAYLLAAFILLPIVELALLLRVGAWLGVGRTLFLVIVTGLLGAFLARSQGAMVIRRIQLDLSQGRMPAAQLIDGLMILIAGALLITPGLLTDTVGFLLLAPPVRAAIRARMRAWLEARLRDGSTDVTIWRW